MQDRLLSLQYCVLILINDLHLDGISVKQNPSP
jgi:hypothetical protein